MSLRPTLETRRATPTLEGAGVKLHRAFGFQDPSELDPFLLFDDFRNDRPEDFEKGFPWHPHRGIETITYVLEGTVEHADSLGNTGDLNAGDVQWMTAGSGILHQEMPRGNDKGQMHGFQLWGNLPSAQKMTAPRYQDMKASDIPVVTEEVKLSEALLEISNKRMGMTTVVDKHGALAGIFTDGDLRRALDTRTDINQTMIGQLMSTGAKTIEADMLAAAAMSISSVSVIANALRLRAASLI